MSSLNTDKFSPDPLTPEHALQKFTRRDLPYWKTALALLILFLFGLFATVGDGGSGGGAGGGHGTGYGDGSGSGSGGISGSGISANGTTAGNGQEQPQTVPDAGNPEPQVADEKPAGQQGASSSSPRSAIPPKRTWTITDNPENPSAGAPVTGTSPGPVGAGGGGGGFYGERVNQNQNVVFIVDVSSSMETQAQEGTRLEVLKRELKKAIFVSESNLSGRRGNYLICCYSSMAWGLPTQRPCWRFGHPVHQKEAFAAIEAMYTNGGTEMHEAWRMAEPLFAKNKINAVYFLTDGEPTDRFDLDAFRSYWAGHKGIKLHCIAIGGHSQLLQEIAQEAGGSYRVCK